MTMGHMPLLVIIVVVLLIGVLFTGNRGQLRVEAKPLMTAIERQTIVYLEQALPDARIHAQVCMGAIIKPVRGLSKREQLATRGRFSQKMVDFVIEDRATGRVLALVELDDRSHRAESDARRDAITAAAGYLTIRLPSSRRPSAANVRDAVTAALFAPRSALQGYGDGPEPVGA